MKMLTSIAFLLLFFSLPSFAQNLVPDGSFEQKYACPTMYGSVRLGILKHWQANPSDCTPDYFHKCNDEGFSVPQNNCGKIQPVRGEAYVGLIMRVGEPENTTDYIERDYREHIQTKLSEVLEPSSRYVVKLHVAISSYSNFAIGNIGLLFTSTPTPIDHLSEFPAQVKFSKIISNKKWVTLVDTFIARGGEEYLTIGEFEKPENKTLIKLPSKKNYQKKFSYNRAYYYIDDVSVVFLDKLPQLSAAQYEKTKWQNIETDFGKLEVGKPIVLENVFFEFGKADLLDASKTELNKLVKLLKTYPSLHITITGHTDNVGDTQNNLELSTNRAKSVYNFLTNNNIDATRLQYEGMGSQEPIDDNNSEKGRQKNRRVEFFVSK